MYYSIVDVLRFQNAAT